MAGANPSHPKFLALLDAGITDDELASAAAEATAKGKGFAYALAIAEGRRRDASAVGSLPNSRASPGHARDDERREVIRVLTGKGDAKNGNERDITGEAERIA